MLGAPLGGFDSKRTPVLSADVLVIGGGLAGASAALTAAREGAATVVLSKTLLTETNTAYAQGGIAAVLGPHDSFTRHLEDTLRVGAGLCDESVARHFISRGPEAVRMLEQWGMVFDQNPDGSLMLGREGGHTAHRVVHASGTRTGAVMQNALVHSLRVQPSVTVREGAFARDLLISDGRCVGVVCHSPAGDLGIAAGAVVLATGGAGQIYRETTNPIGACADGLAMALRAGCELADLEFVQFHPTTLYIAGASRYLISEVVRGAGAVLRDRNGRAFMQDVHPDADLAPRDVVSRAILERMVELGDTHVYLDMSTIDDPKGRFPTVAKICGAFDIDIAVEPIPVRPGAHYMIGGVHARPDGGTDLPGLWAVGEVACTGFHGANRLASNSLLEAALMGSAAGMRAAEEARLLPVPRLPRITPPAADGHEPPKIQLDDMLYSLKSLMWRQVGLLRNANGLKEAGERIALWQHYLRRAGMTGVRSFELANMLAVAGLVTSAAHRRTESRGTHYRTDYPQRDENWSRRSFARLGPDGVVVRDGDRLPPTDRPMTQQR
jgi:L-aspartate oxidase